MPQFTPDVTVTNVLQQDVPQYSEWVGTTEGFVNANIYPKISGYIVKQDYQDGDVSTPAKSCSRSIRANIRPHSIRRKANLAKESGQSQEGSAEPQALHGPLQPGMLYRGRNSTIRRRPRTPTMRRSKPSKRRVETGAAQPRVDSRNFARQRRGLDCQLQVGDLVSPTTLLTTVSQLDPIKVEFPISEQLYLSVARSDKSGSRTSARKRSPLFR